MIHSIVQFPNRANALAAFVFMVAASLAGCSSGPETIRSGDLEKSGFVETAKTGSAGHRVAKFGGSRSLVEQQLVDSLLALMTVEEKLGQLAQYAAGWSETGPKVQEGGVEDIRNGLVGSFLGVFGAEYTRELQRIAVEESRLGIPLLFGYDVIHGFRTIFPVPLAEAASWDLDAMENTARLAAIEASANGLHWTFAPMVDIGRDPRWGRVVEGAGEDPYLGSKIAAARVRGFQGTDLGAHNTLLATAKHFAAYGGAEGGRDYNIVDISERTLREVYLPPFKAAVEAGVETLMASFNEINGVPAHASRKLMTDILRDEWGFDGLVVSDYTGVLELMPHGVAATRADAGLLAIKAGIDIDMVSGIYAKDLPPAVESGRLDVETVNEAVRRVLRAKYRLGLFEDPYRYSDVQREASNTLTPELRNASRKMAAESIVLLKNEGKVLPVAKATRTIAVIGPLADDSRTVLGGWAMRGRAEESVTILQGVKNAVSSDTQVLHAAGSDIRGDSTEGFANAIHIAKQADVILLVVGEDQEMSSEANNRTSLELPGVQQQLAEAIVATGKPVIVVLMNGRPLSVQWLDDHAAGIIEAWYLGNEMGNAVADVVFGDVNPSGKLPVTFPRNVGQIPIYYNYRTTGRPADEKSKYTSKYIDAPFTPLYPFGYGLSYTDFEYSDLKLSSRWLGKADTLTVTARITNTGDRPGADIVQLYIRDVVASVTRPIRELKGFQRVELDAGGSTTVSFSLTTQDLAFYNQDLDFVTEPGEFKLYVAPSAVDGIEAGFSVTEGWTMR